VQQDIGNALANAFALLELFDQALSAGGEMVSHRMLPTNKPTIKPKKKSRKRSESSFSSVS
jgi:hypothetical protein